MFKHHHSPHRGHHPQRAKGEHDWPLHGGAGGGRGGRGRLFGHGDMRLILLHLLQQGPQHGYELIKAIETLAGGDYSPSPGVIYPTLTLLEESGLLQASADDGGRRQFQLTEAGQAALVGEQAALQRILTRLSAAARIASARHNPQVHRAMQNLKMALQLRFAEGEPEAETLARIAAAIDRAAVEIEQLK